jgi:hypothetical protein
MSIHLSHVSQTKNVIVSKFGALEGNVKLFILLRLEIDGLIRPPLVEILGIRNVCAILVYFARKVSSSVDAKNVCKTIKY